MTSIFDLSTRKTIVSFVEACGTCPEGNPDDDNRPHVIKRRGDDHGMIWPVALKRYSRDYLALREGYALYIARGADLGAVQEVYLPTNPTSEDLAGFRRAFIDIRLYGGFGRQKVTKGPVAFGLAVTLDPVTILEGQGSCVARHRGDGERADGRPAMQEGDGQAGALFPRGAVIDYGLYKSRICYTPENAPHLEPGDLAAFYRSVVYGMELSRAAIRPGLQFFGLYIIEHGTAKGRMLDRHAERCVQVVRRDGEPLGVTAAFGPEDYEVQVDPSMLMPGMTVTRIDDTNYKDWDQILGEPASPAGRPIEVLDESHAGVEVRN